MKAVPDPEPKPGEIWWRPGAGPGGIAVSIRSKCPPLLPYYRVITADGRVRLTKLEEMRPATHAEAEQYRKARQSDIARRKEAQETWRAPTDRGKE